MGNSEPQDFGLATGEYQQIIEVPGPFKLLASKLEYLIRAVFPQHAALGRKAEQLVTHKVLLEEGRGSQNFVLAVTINVYELNAFGEVNRRRRVKWFTEVMFP